jgi:hypothetical protein
MLSTMPVTTVLGVTRENLRRTFSLQPLSRLGACDTNAAGDGARSESPLFRIIFVLQRALSTRASVILDLAA